MSARTKSQWGTILLTTLGLLYLSASNLESSPDAVVVFNEIQYNPQGPSEEGEWIELFNQMGVLTDLSGWRIDGIDFTFPPRTFIAPGGYLVVAKQPTAGQLGPFSGNLENGGEKLRLLNQSGRLMDELSYGDDGRWPASADGSGVTLSKLNPYTANMPPENWTFSSLVDGTPGRENFPQPPTEHPLVINEMPPSASEEFWVELANTGLEEISLGGLVVCAGGDPTRKHVLEEAILSSGAFLLLTGEELGFRPAANEKLFLYDSGEARVLDACEQTGRLRGRSSSRAGSYLYPLAPTPGAPNQFAFHDEVVISEIMYNPPPIPSEAPSDEVVTDSTNQWVEVTNRTDGPVSLAGWEFDDGISFTFAPNTVLEGGESACVARDETAFRLAYPGARLLGEFDGSLSRSSERLSLRDHHRNPVDVVHYHDSGRWPHIPDGGGASLELRDLHADNSIAESWASSNESHQTAWRTYVYQGTLNPSQGPDGKWQEFNLGLLGEGEVLIDDMEVLENRRTEKLINGNFSQDARGWRFRGTHRHSEIVPDPEDPDNMVLRLVASGATGHMHNQIETTLRSPVVNNRFYTIRFRARWMSGSNQLHSRLYFNRLPHVTMLDRPLHVGTPGAPNSSAVPNLGPSVPSMRHSPAVPEAGQSVQVTARATDPDGIRSMSLLYSVTGQPFRRIPMNEEEAGTFVGIIPGQTRATVVQFYLEGEDLLGEKSLFPSAGPDSRALYKVDDGLAATNGQHNFRIVVTDAERDFMHRDVEVMSNDRIGATIIDREEDVYYDVKLRLKGSQRARSQDPRVGYNMRFGRDNLYRGTHQSLAIDRSEGVGEGQFEFLFDIMIANSGGVLSRYYDFIKVLAPRDRHTRSAVLQMARYDDVFLESQFNNGSDGNLYEYELIYSPDRADSQGAKFPQPDSVQGVVVSDRGNDKERYRWFFLKKNNREKDNFAPIIAYNKKFSQSNSAFEQDLEQVVDVDSWLRGMAYAVLSGAGDNTGAGSQHNGMYYARPDGRVIFFPHDMDFAFNANRSLFANPECARLTSNPSRLRIYLGHIQDIITTTYNRTYMGRWVSHLARFDRTQNWNGHLSYIQSRSNFARAEVNRLIRPVSFSISTASPLRVSGSTATLNGRGWVDVRHLRLVGAGQPLAVEWTDSTSWQATLPVATGAREYTIEAVGFSGEVITRDTITIENTSSLEPASAENLTITEIMYHPAEPTSSEVALGFEDDDLFEFIELSNIGEQTINLEGVTFTSGIEFTFSSQLLGPGQKLILARNREAFRERYSPGDVNLFPGDYFLEPDNNRLSNDGEELVLNDALGNEICRIDFEDDGLWPTHADGDGYSLVLLEPHGQSLTSTPDNWRLSTRPGGNPGGSDSAEPFTGDPHRDSDNDQWPALLEHAMGTSDIRPDSMDLVSIAIESLPDESGQNQPYLTISFPRNLAADDLRLQPQVSHNLESWSDLETLLVESTPNGRGILEVTYRSPTPLNTNRQSFLRLQASRRTLPEDQ